MKHAQLRQLIDERFRQVEYFDNLAEAFWSVDGLERRPLREYVVEQGFLKGDNYRAVCDPTITRILLLEADEYLGKALANLCLACCAMYRGYLSWGEVTTYYASFYAIHGLLRLQGKALGVNYVLFPASIRNPASIVKHEYAVVRPSSDRRIHEDVWRKFFDTYSQNTDIPQDEYADVIFFSDVQDIILEVERRNQFNYWMFGSYGEIYDQAELARRDLFNLPALEPAFFENLTHYLGDGQRKFVARAALRIRLLHELLSSTVEGAAMLDDYFRDRHGQRLSYLDTVIAPSDPLTRTSIEDSCLVLPPTP